jgi:hypothetical protein
MAEPGRNLALILATQARFGEGGGPEALRSLLAEDVFWQGVRPELACQGPADVLRFMRQGRAGAPRITRLEAREAGDRVAVVVESPDFPEDGVLPPDAPRSLVFFFGPAGRIVRIESWATPEEAFGRLEAPA